MERDLTSLTQGGCDLLIVGAGIYGAAAAWDAALRGLDVVLVEQGDFMGATSANSLKVIHGGFRYLQSMDLPRLRLSAGELVILERIAPYLVGPLYSLLPTKGWGKQSRLALGVALALYNRLIPEAKHKGRLISRQECEELFPSCLAPDADGGAVWPDGLVHDSERLGLAYILGACERGARAANYLRVTDLIREGGRITGARASDLIGGGELEIKARSTLITAGPWLEELCGNMPAPPYLAQALNLVVERRLCSSAVALRSPLDASQDPVCGGHRFIFMVPWQGRTMLGTAYRVWPRGRAPQGPTQDDLISLLAEFNAACPGLGLTLGDVSFFHWGRQHLAAPDKWPGHGGLLTKRRIKQWQGAVLATGAKYTTARAVAAEAVETACRAARMIAPVSRSHEEPLWGAEHGMGMAMPDLPDQSREHLTAQYGSRAGQVAALAGDDAALLSPLAPGTPVMGCEVVQAVNNEMAQTLSDVALRRTVLGKAGRPSDAALDAACMIMAKNLGWTQEKQQKEKQELLKYYEFFGELT